MVALSIPTIAFGTGILLVAVIIGWNRLVRWYNDRLLAKARCRSCGTVLGNAPIAPARAIWRAELRSMQQAGKGGIKRSNLQLLCPHCGEMNLERDIYEASKKPSGSSS